MDDNSCMQVDGGKQGGDCAQVFSKWKWFSFSQKRHYGKLATCKREFRFYTIRRSIRFSSFYSNWLKSRWMSADGESTEIANKTLDVYSSDCSRVVNMFISFVLLCVCVRVVFELDSPHKHSTFFWYHESIPFHHILLASNSLLLAPFHKRNI